MYAVIKMWVFYGCKYKDSVCGNKSVWSKLRNVTLRAEMIVPEDRKKIHKRAKEKTEAVFQHHRWFREGICADGVQ